MRIRATGGPVYQLKVTLRGIRPPIWRRFLVPGDIPLKRLHDALQAVMGWTDSHLHQFKAHRLVYGTSDREFGIERVSERTTTLDQVLRQPKASLRYEYDFGDGWEHDVVLETVLAAEPEGRYPWILAGARARPPEDVGGSYGYAGFLEILANPGHPEFAESLEWAGGAFDPAAFDVGEANLAIHGGWVRRKPGAG